MKLDETVLKMICSQSVGSLNLSIGTTTMSFMHPIQFQSVWATLVQQNL